MFYFFSLIVPNQKILIVVCGQTWLPVLSSLHARSIGIVISSNIDMWHQVEDTCRLYKRETRWRTEIMKGTWLSVINNDWRLDQINCRHCHFLQCHVYPVVHQHMSKEMKHESWRLLHSSSAAGIGTHQYLHKTHRGNS